MTTSSFDPQHKQPDKPPAAEPQQQPTETAAAEDALALRAAMQGSGGAAANPNDPATPRTTPLASVPTHSRPQTVMRMQRLVGNHAVQRLLGQHSGVVQREGPDTKSKVSKEDIAWAKKLEKKLEKVQDAAGEAANRLNADAKVAIGHLEKISESYKKFQALYDSAVEAFVEGVKKAQEREKQMREAVSKAASLIIGVAAPHSIMLTAYTATADVISKVGDLALIAAAASGKQPANKGTGKSPDQVGRGEKAVDWGQLVDTTIKSYKDTMTNNATIQGVEDRAKTLLRFLDEVEDEEYALPVPPQSEPRGLLANTMFKNADQITSNLSKIGPGSVSQGLPELDSTMASKLGATTRRKLEQDLAIKWMATLSYRSEEEYQIRDARAYLTKIGVLGTGNTRSDVDVSWYATFQELDIVLYRAKWENLAMNMVGQNLTWLGSGGSGKTTRGKVRDTHNQTWPVSLSEAAPAEGGGSIQLTGYSVNHDPRVQGWLQIFGGTRRASNWKEVLRWEISFSGVPSGQMGGGAAPAYQGPSYRAPSTF